MTISRFPFLFVTAMALLPACTGASPYMAPTTTSAVETVAEMATVVFVRPSQFGGADRVVIVDGKGRFLGETMPATHFAVKMPAGEHTFISCGENTSAVKATLAAGKVYFVEAYGPTGPSSPRLELRAVTLRSSVYGKIDEWLGHTTALAPDEAKGQAYLVTKGGVQSEIARGDRVYAGYDAKDKPEHTLAVEDGK